MPRIQLSFDTWIGKAKLNSNSCPLPTMYYRTALEVNLWLLWDFLSFQVGILDVIFSSIYGGLLKGLFVGAVASSCAVKVSAGHFEVNRYLSTVFPLLKKNNSHNNNK